MVPCTLIIGTVELYRVICDNVCYKALTIFTTSSCTGLLISCTPMLDISIIINVGWCSLLQPVPAIAPASCPPFHASHLSVIPILHFTLATDSKQSTDEYWWVHWFNSLAEEGTWNCNNLLYAYSMIVKFCLTGWKWLANLRWLRMKNQVTWNL